MISTGSICISLHSYLNAVYPKENFALQRQILSDASVTDLYYNDTRCGISSKHEVPQHVWIEQCVAKSLANMHPRYDSEDKTRNKPESTRTCDEHPGVDEALC